MESAAMMPAERSADSSSPTWPASTNTGIPAGRRAVRERADHLAVQRLLVEPAFAGDDQSAASTSSARRVCSAMIAAPDSQRPPSASSPAPIPPAAPAPGSALTSRPATASSSQRPRLEADFECRDGVGVRALLRAEHPGRAPRPQQRIFDVGGGDQLDIGQLPAGGVQAAELVDHAVAAVGARAAAQPDHDPRRPGPQRRGDQLPHSPAVGGQRGLRRRRTAEQAPARTPAHIRGRRSPSRVEHPLGVHRRCPAARITRIRRISPSRLASTSTKPGPPSDCGATMNWSPGRDRVQPVAIAAAASTAERLSP